MSIKKSDVSIIGAYRGLMDTLVKTRGFRGYSTLDYCMERIRSFDPEYFKDQDELAAFQAAGKEKV